MCLITFAHRARAGLELLVAANRDEFFGRPACAAAFWPDHPDILAGRDVQAGGTWLGISRSGRFAAITNFRDPSRRRTEAPSRGALVGNFLLGSMPPSAYFEQIRPGAADYNGFSLLAGVPGELSFFSNRADAGIGAMDLEPRTVVPGIHGLSNHLLDEPWPKVVRSCAALDALLDAPFEPESFFTMLADETIADDSSLPDTGVGIERERRSSAIRIRDPIYGTRCSTVLRVLASGLIEFYERSYAPDGTVQGTVEYRLQRD